MGQDSPFIFFDFRTQRITYPAFRPRLLTVIRCQTSSLLAIVTNFSVVHADVQLVQQLLSLNDTLCEYLKHKPSDESSISTIAMTRRDTEVFDTFDFPPAIDTTGNASPGNPPECVDDPPVDVLEMAETALSALIGDDDDVLRYACTYATVAFEVVVLQRDCCIVLQALLEPECCVELMRCMLFCYS